MKRVIIMSPVPTIIILPSGGWTSKKNVLLMYKEPILPKCVSSQQTQAMSDSPFLYLAPAFFWLHISSVLHSLRRLARFYAQLVLFAGSDTHTGQASSYCIFILSICSLRRILTTVTIRHIGLLDLSWNMRSKRINAVTSRYYLRQTGLVSMDYFIPPKFECTLLTICLEDTRRLDAATRCRSIATLVSNMEQVDVQV